MASLENSEALPIPQNLTPDSSAGGDGGTSPAIVDVPCMYDTRSEVEEVLKNPKSFKRFIKRTKCAQCGVRAMSTRFKNSSGMMVACMIDTFYCGGSSGCGRLLCDKHRNQHTCERVDAIAAKKRAMTPEQIQNEVREKEMARAQREAEAQAEKQATVVDQARGFAERKARRKLIASKSTHVANFLQRSAVQATVQRVRQELLELYTVVNARNLELWNEFESPTVPGTKDDSWREVVAAYRRASEITGLVVTLEGQPLEMRNPWDDPQPPQSEAGTGGST